MNKQIILYGLSGADKQYRVLSYYCIYEDDISIQNMLYQASTMVFKNPEVKTVYAIDNRPGLKRDYIESYKKNSIESCAIFKDLLEKYGFKII